MVKDIIGIPYVVTPQRTLYLDLHIPPSQTRVPLVLFIPMGGMRFCRKEDSPLWLVEEGFAMASIECRVTSEVTAPAPIHDCKSAIRWLRAHADQYGYNGDAIGVWGHSAGGLLSSLMATSGGVPELEGDGPNLNISSKVQAACDQCGAPHDFACFARPDIKSRFSGVTENIRLYLGGTVEEKPNVARLVSPATYVTAACPPILQIHGDQDDVVPLEDSIAFHEQLLAAGVDSTLSVLPGIGHGWDANLTKPTVISFFNRTLKK